MYKPSVTRPPSRDYDPVPHNISLGIYVKHRILGNVICFTNLPTLGNLGRLGAVWFVLWIQVLGQGILVLPLPLVLTLTLISIICLLIFSFFFSSGLDLYSTTLWHLQNEVALSALAQELVETDRTSPQVREKPLQALK